MTDPRGPWFELENAHDLYGKLLHDLRRVEVGPLDSYAAFDFFVTANHLLDWWLPPHGTRQERDDARRAFLRQPQHDLARTCADVANGVKHFLQRTPTRARTGVHSGGFSAGFDRGFEVSRLVVRHGDPQQEIDVFELAQRVVADWEARLGPAARSAPHVTQ